MSHKLKGILKGWW